MKYLVKTGKYCEFPQQFSEAKYTCHDFYNLVDANDNITTCENKKL